MSGLTCPDCHCQHLGGDGCLICGWDGEHDPEKIAKGYREWLTPEGYERCHELYKLKGEGKLFYMRIYLDDPDNTWDAVMGLKDVLVNGKADIKRGNTIILLQSRSEGKPYLVKFYEEPPQNLIEKLKSLDGVIKVVVN